VYLKTQTGGTHKIFHLSFSCMHKRVHARHDRIFEMSMVDLFTLRFHWNVTNCSGIRINNTRIILQCIWGGFILIQYNCGKLWNSGIIRTATKQKSKQREFRFLTLSHLPVKGETCTCHYTFSTSSVNLIYNLLPHAHQLLDGSRIFSRILSNVQ
jgi:hypothetical protein